MSIAWRYLDKRSATIKALYDYSAMKHIVDTPQEDLAMEAEELESSLTNPSSSYSDGTPRSNNPRAGESRVLHLINKLNADAERYQLAQEYMKWFMPAWEHLSQEEQLILSLCYMTSDSNNAMDTLCAKLNVEKANAYKKRGRALERMQMLLFGG